jgi:hypothetical protein
VKRLVLGLALGLVALPAGGCGGGGDDAGTTDEDAARSVVGMPKPKQPVSAQVGDFEQAFEEESCERLKPLFFSTIRSRPPGAPATKEECRGGGAETARLAGLVSLPILQTHEYGTAALMEAPGSHGAENDYTIWVLDSDGRFRFTQVQVNDDAQFDTEFTSGDAAEAIAGKLVRAVERHDCKALLPLFNGASRLVAGRSPGEVCESVLDGKYFAPALRDTPEPVLEPIGGTRSFAFVGVRTTDAYFTVTMAGGPDQLEIFDVLPNTPLAPAEGET